MKKQHILVIDDEQDLCEILRFNLTAAGYQADVAYSAEEVLDMDVTQYDLLLLDVMMPGMSGFELARHLKQDPATASIPIIFLTALGDEKDKLHGFDLGADDYIAKPFSVRETLARVKAVLARMTPSLPAEHELCYKGLKMDLDKMSVSVDGQPVSLTKTEYELLKLFLENRGQVFSRQEVLERVWPRDVVVTDRTVDVNITRMRKKIGPYSSSIVTRHGFGYLFIS
ncbi:MAG: response regulator transcription factor [Muribaculaceae bacterium]|nr:response regulator transcription factor [Muribaculaceae bacterium]